MLRCRGVETPRFRQAIFGQAHTSAWHIRPAVGHHDGHDQPNSIPEVSRSSDRAEKGAASSNGEHSPIDAFVYEPRCAVCDKAATHVELRDEAGYWRLLFEGIAVGNGSGDIIEPADAARVFSAFHPEPNPELICAEFYDGAGYCRDCGVAYCYDHWRPTSTGFGTCPPGHGKSLDPHWSP